VVKISVLREVPLFSDPVTYIDPNNIMMIILTGGCGFWNQLPNWFLCN